jgi:hypothetical protein
VGGTKKSAAALIILLRSGHWSGKSSAAGGGQLQGPKKVTTVTSLSSKITTAFLREGFLVFVEIGKSGGAVQGANMLSYVRGFYIIS